MRWLDFKNHVLRSEHTIHKGKYKVVDMSTYKWEGKF